MSLSCPCGSGCRPGCGCLYQVVLPDNPVAEYNFQNVGLLGIGVLDGVDGVDVNFRSIASANAALTVTLDAGNNAIVLTLDIGSIIDDLPQATTAQRGVGETATDAEAQAKVSTTVFVTPSNFAAMASSTTFAGLVELATDGETQTGTSTTLAVTPAGLASVIALQQGTETWTDAVTRLAATPDFDGQLGAELDNNSVWVSVGTNAGDFNRPLLVLGETIAPPVASTTTILMTGGESIQFTMNNSTSNVMLAGTGSLILDSAVDWQPSQPVKISSFNIPSQLLGTDAGSLIAGYSVSDFVSANNTQTGYTNFANPAVLRTCDTATVTLPQLAQIVGTLINDLKAIKLPAT